MKFRLDVMHNKVAYKKGDVCPKELEFSMKAQGLVEGEPLSEAPVAPEKKPEPAPAMPEKDSKGSKK